MSLYTIYGINGVGKDAVARNIQQAGIGSIEVTSSSRMLMYLLGITDTYDAFARVTDVEYHRLDSLDTAYVDEVEQAKMPELVNGFAENRQKKVIVLSHLVVAHFLSGHTEYRFGEQTSEWYVRQNESVVQLVAPSYTIMGRREKDARWRERPLSVTQIEEHQRLCDEQWRKIGRIALALSRPSMTTISNIDLQVATAEVVKKLGL